MLLQELCSAVDNTQGVSMQGVSSLGYQGVSGSDGPGCRGMGGAEQNPEVSPLGSTPRGRMFPFPWRPHTSKAFGTTDRQHSLSDELGS